MENRGQVPNPEHKERSNSAAVSNERMRIILIISVITSVAILIHMKFLGIPVGQRVLFFYLNQYLYFLIPSLIFVLLPLLIPRLYAAGQVVAVFLLGVVGYVLAEIVYAHFHSPLPSQSSHALELIFGDLNGYFLNRCYQYLSILLMVAVLFPSRKEIAESYLKFGDWNKITKTINEKRPESWKRVVFRVSGFVLGMAVFALILRVILSDDFWASNSGVINYNVDFFMDTKFQNLMRPLRDQLILIPSNFLGAINNCFIEEFIFRGILLTVFCRAIGEKRGNFLQALLFGLVHFPSFNFWHYLAKIIVFTFLGWLFGRATIETGGIKGNWIMHTMIVISMYIAQTV